MVGVEIEHAGDLPPRRRLPDRGRPSAGSTPSRRAFEFLSDLSARDFTLLTRSGWWPLGLVAGASFVVAPRRAARQWAAQKGQNLELPNLTEALYLAREGAMDRMQQAGPAMKADGVINVKLREGPLGYSARVMQFVAVGTAVHLRDDEHRRINPTMVVPLDDPRPVQFDGPEPARRRLTTEGHRPCPSS